jgi:hypothetical protein
MRIEATNLSPAMMPRLEELLARLIEGRNGAETVRSASVFRSCSLVLFFALPCCI